VRVGLGVLAALLAGAGPLHAFQAGERTAGVAWVVLDAATGEPVPHAVVEIASQARTTRSDSTGRFRMVGLQPQIIGIRLRALGYEAVERSLNLFAGRTVTVEYLLTPTALALPEVEVSGQPSRSILHTGGFEDRRRMGNGRFYTEDEISRHLQRRVPDLLRDAQGMRIASGPGNEFYAVNTRQVMTSIIPSRNRGACFLDIIVDGMVVWSAHAGERGVPPVDLAFLVSLSDLLGVEVYTGLASVPAEYRRAGSTCGAILFWTRRGQSPAADPPGSSTAA
jgi:hypothetical protein